MESYFSYSLSDLRLGRNINQHIEKYRKQYLDPYDVLLVRPIGINLGLIEELRNQGYKVKEIS